MVAPVVIPEEVTRKTDDTRRTNFTKSRNLQVGLIALEICIIAVWCFALVLDFRNTTKYEIIGGADFPISVQGRFFWDHVRSCGMCALWNGDIRGGAPAYVDANVDLFHPVAAIPAYLFGVLQGAKVAVPIALFLGAMSVWWLALELGTGSIARVSSAMTMAASGAMIGRLQEGLVVLITATASAALVLPALIHLTKHPTRRSAGLLGLILGGTVVSGQGYIQLGLIIMSPLVVTLIIRNPVGWKQILFRLVQAALVGLAVAMIFLYPFLRVYGDFGKVYDVGFGAYQPMKYLALNLAISDLEFMDSELLHKAAFAAWYGIYVGWIAIAFAVVGFGLLWRRSKRLTVFLAASFLASLWVGSGAPYRLMANPWFATDAMRLFAWSVRIPSFVAALAIPPLLGFAAIAINTGINSAFRNPVPNGVNSLERSRSSTASSWAMRLLIMVLLVFSLRDLYHFAREWMWVDNIDAEIAEEYIATLRTPELAWVSPLTNDSALNLLGMDADLKYSDSWRSWYFDAHEELPPSYLAVQPDNSAREGMVQTGVWLTYYVYKSTVGNEYVTSNNGGSCSASGEGGDIDVRCSLPQPSRVVVQENNVGSWQATIDGIAAPVVSEGQWIAVDAPAGDVEISFRFRPRDFWIGLAGSFIGLIIAITMIAIPNKYRFHLNWKQRPRLPHRRSSAV